MEKTRILLTGIWIALMLTYLLGDVLRIFTGQFVPGEINGVKTTQGMGLLMAVLMMIPIVMLVLTLLLGQPTVRWINIIAAVFLVIFNIAGLPYEGLFDNFLIGVGFIFNALTLYLAWTWK